MRLIDADALHDDLRTKQKWIVKREDKHNEGYTYDQVHFAIDDQPTVDAVPAIRCKDCRHYTGKWCTRYSTKQFDINDIRKDDNDFCSQAERKDDV